MKTAYLLLPLACAVPVLQSCSTTPATAMSGYGLEPQLEARNSSESPEMYYRVGRYWQAQGALDKAAQAYRRAIALQSDYPEAANALATVDALRGDYDGAVKLLQAAAEKSPRAAYVQNNLGYVLYLKGDYEAAVPPLERAVALDPGYARAHSNLALAYAKTGQAQKAGDHRSEALRLARLVDAVGGANPPARTLSAAAGPIASAAGNAMKAGEAVPARSPSPGALPQPVASAAAPALRIMQVAPNVYELRAPASVVPPPAIPSVRASAAAVPLPMKDVRAFRLEVSNGNGVTGMARRMSDRLRTAGLTPVRLTNQKPYQRVTEIQYAPGYAAEAARLAALVRQQALMIHTESLRPDIKVRLVLGQDVRDETAFLTLPGGEDRTRVAQSN